MDEDQSSEPEDEGEYLADKQRKSTRTGNFPELVNLICSYAQTKLVSPSGRDVAQRQRGLGFLARELDLPQAKTEGVLSD